VEKAIFTNAVEYYSVRVRAQKNERI
jgi:hypothetical protein